MPVVRPPFHDSLPKAYAVTDSSVAAWPGTVVAKDSISAAQTVVEHGTVGEPLPYNPRTDDVITITLLISSFAIVWLVVHSWGFIARTAASFFYDLRPHRAIPTDGTDLDEVGDTRLLHLHTAFLISLAYVCYARFCHPESFLDTKPYGLLVLGILLVVGWYIVRALLYKFIDSVFFEKWQHILWQQARVQSTFLISLILLPLLLVDIYFALNGTIYTACVLFIIAVSRLALLMKCYSTFFTYRGGVIHLILYFCTLEIAPLAALWRLLEAMG